jgi:release factor glutamine methyltransferase
MEREISAFEPNLAFDGGPFGVKIIRRLIADAPELLRPGGWLVFEVGLGQGGSMARMLRRDSHYDLVESRADQNGDVRALAARRL